MLKYHKEVVADNDKQRAVLNCMGRIIARAEEQQLAKGKIQDLKTMYKTFGGTSAQKAPAEKVNPLVI